jgi:antitoxin component of RelBE/YafQ-DinJ toxin-antitoxin module
VKTEILKLRISEQLKHQAEEMANKKQMSISEFIRYLIQKEVDNNAKSI